MRLIAINRLTALIFFKCIDFLGIFIKQNDWVLFFKKNLNYLHVLKLKIQIN